jgi:hypothetical protein
MFTGVSEKLECAGYFLNSLKTLADEAGGFSYIFIRKQQEVRANLDGFFFEIISAKDFFLQGINDTYKLGLRKNNATDTSQLKCQLGLSGLQPRSDTRLLRNVFKVVESVEKLLSDKGSWLWRLNNYRNSATHRELLHYWNIAEGPTIEVREGEEPQFQIILDPETKIPTQLKRIDIPSGNYEFQESKTYLFKDPEDPSQGRADIEVIPYCEESLTRMKELLERLYSELELE